MTRFLLLFLLLALLLPGAASAATVSVGPPPTDLLYHRLRFSGAAGETNRVTITVAKSETIVRDGGAPLTAGAGCSPLDVHSARCTAPLRPPLGGPELSIDAVVAELGDRDDALTVAFPRPIRVPTRTPGRTELEVAAAALVVDAGAGADVVDAARAHIAAPLGPRFSPSPIGHRPRRGAEGRLGRGHARGQSQFRRAGGRSGRRCVDCRSGLG